MIPALLLEVLVVDAVLADMILLLKKVQVIFVLFDHEICYSDSVFKDFDMSEIYHQPIHLLDKVLKNNDSSIFLSMLKMRQGER
jgi:hypothetical protein